MMKKIAVVISCEHAVDTVPQEYRLLFAPYRDLLASHRGVDFGALGIAQYLSEFWSCDLIQAATTRLLIDCNRSLNHYNCFSEVTRVLKQDTKQLIINEYYQPYRQKVLAAINAQIEQGLKVWHLSIHSFTPVMNNITRNTDIGFLYDPKRHSEKILARLWQLELKITAPEYRVRMNYPYSGISDGLVSALRKRFTEDDYLGIELELNQNLVHNSQLLDRLKSKLAKSLLTLNP